VVVSVFSWEFLNAETLAGLSCRQRSGVITEMDSVLKLLFRRYEKLRNRMRQRWQRDLPFDELLFDRWERAKSLGFGEGSSIYHNSYIYGKVKVGGNTWIGPYTLLDGSGGLVIGEYCSISAGVQIYTHDTVKWALSGGKAEYERAPVMIGNCSYVGSHTIVSKGVTIGDHCVIGACSFVNRDIPPYTVAFGIPCRPAGRVNIDENGGIVLLYDGKDKCY
jgi:acetyltransferase-like isoleucine patch superfamily enzyme